MRGTTAAGFRSLNECSSANPVIGALRHERQQWAGAAVVALAVGSSDRLILHATSGIDPQEMFGPALYQRQIFALSRLSFA